MDSAQGYRELVAHLEPHRPRLGEPKMVGVGRAFAADQTRLRGHELRWALSRSRRGSPKVSLLLSILAGAASACDRVAVVGSSCAKRSAKPALRCWRQFSSVGSHTTLPFLNAPISSAENPNSASISSVCSPNSGGPAAGFDVTPARLMSGLITERGMLPADRLALARAFPEQATNG